MKCQILFTRKNKINISKCRLLKIFPSMQSDNIGKIDLGFSRPKNPKKVMKAAILSHSMEVITLVFFVYSDHISARIFHRICLDSLNPKNEHKNSLFPLTKSKCLFFFFLISWQIFKLCQLVNDSSTTIKTEDGAFVEGKQWRRWRQPVCPYRPL